MSKRTPSITPSKNGPLVVRHLEALKASTGRNVNTKASTVALCRCGGSKSKPYCDGTHGKNGFTDEKDKTRVPRRHDVYEGKTVTIHDDRGICSHAGYCTDGLPEVFQMGKEPWIDPDGASEDAIRKTIEKCPSGALSYEIDGKRFTAFASDEPELEITKDGPYRAKGFIDLESDDVPESKEHFALCRCGASKNKPFCDGSHHYEQFEDDGRFDPKIKGKEASKVPFDNHYDHIKNLSNDPEIEHSAMRTLETFPDFKTLLFKAAQLERMPLHKDEDVSLKTVIGKHAKKPLTIDLPFYVSHMSFGALSKEAKIALAKGSALASTATCSGEGGMPAEERDAAKYYIYEQGTAAFNYDEEKMKQADAIELKIGQGVKPGVGGYLPAHKVTEEIAKVRGLSENEASSAPNRLEGVDSTDDLKKRVDAIRKLTGGVPIGIKIATGNLEKDMSRALRAGPDFITIDCRGGATGASPTFLKDNVGIPPIYA
ncbi:MAG: glutamate synthase-related protein, partial [Bacillota bacterium]